MATDQSPPRTTLILVIAVATVVTLVSLKFIFDSYFTDMMESEARAKVATPEEVVQLHADEQKKLTTSPAVPIDQAMAELGSKGRLFSADIAPQQSDDRAALTGWAHLHEGLPAGASGETTGAPGGGAAPAAGDAGTTTTPPGPPPGFDAGPGNVLPNATGDAGAPKRHAAMSPTTTRAPAGSPSAAVSGASTAVAPASP